MKFLAAILTAALSCSTLAQLTESSGWCQSRISNQASQGIQDLNFRGESAHLELHHRLSKNSRWTFHAAFDWLPDGYQNTITKSLRTDPQLYASYQFSNRITFRFGRIQPYLQTDDFYQANRIGTQAIASQSVLGTFLEGFALRTSLGNDGDYAEFFATDSLFERGRGITDYGLKAQVTRGKFGFTGAITQSDENLVGSGRTNRTVLKLAYAVTPSQSFRIRSGPTQPLSKDSRPIGYEYAYRPDAKHEWTLNIDDYDIVVPSSFPGTPPLRLIGDSQSLTYTNWYARNSSISLQVTHSAWDERIHFFLGSVIRF